MSLASATLLLFLVMDPFGNIPFFLSALQHVEPARQTRVVIRELAFALVALVVFLFLGQHLLALLGISDPALTIAGGILLFLIAVRMVFPSAHGTAEIERGEPFLVPLAIPYVAGPSALSSVLLIMNREPDHWPRWLGALVLAWLASGFVLLLASKLRRFLGRRGLVALERLMGMILVTLAVQMLLDGIGQAVAEPNSTP